MQNYYTAREDKSGDYVTSNHTRYSVSEINPARVHIPAGRVGDMVLLDSIEEFLTSMGLVHLDNHAFPEPEPEPVYVPASATRRQFFLELNAQGIEAILDGFVAQADRATQIEYATAATFDRAWSALNEAIPMLDAFDTERTWDDAFVDTLFIGAAKR